MRFLFLMTLLVWSAGAHGAEPLPVPRGPIVLTITGNIEQTNAPGEARFDAPILEGLGLESLTTQSAMASKPQVFEGVPQRAVLDRLGAKGVVPRAVALNSYRVSIPLDDLQYDPILAMRADGQVLKVRDKGPLWIVYPREKYKILQDVKYAARWVWQLKQLHVE